MTVGEGNRHAKVYEKVFYQLCDSNEFANSSCFDEYIVVDIYDVGVDKI